MHTIESLVEAVERVTGVTVAEMRASHRGHPTVSDARHIAMILARQHTPRTLDSIGRWFGNRDHSTVSHAVSRSLELAESIALVQRYITDGIIPLTSLPPMPVATV